MNWQEIIKALITLPQNNKDSWVEILSSDENMKSFIVMLVLKILYPFCVMKILLKI